MLLPKQKCLAAKHHHLGVSPADSKAVRVPSHTLRTALSATPFVSGRPGVLVECRHPSSGAILLSSGVVGVETLHLFFPHELGQRVRGIDGVLGEEREAVNPLSRSLQDYQRRAVAEDGLVSDVLGNEVVRRDLLTKHGRRIFRIPVVPWCRFRLHLSLLTA